MSKSKSSLAWGVAAPSEPRWPASVAVLLAVALYFVLSERYIVCPRWLIPAVELAILIPLTLAAPRRVPNEPRLRQIAAVALIAIVNISNFASLVLLIQRLVFHGKDVTGPELLFSSMGIWLTNVIVFALWYWELDRGGPDDRLERAHREPDFLFPQMVTPGCTYPGWTPNFIDYLYVAFTNATAFSPTDTMPLTGWAKLLMMAQSLASLLTVALVVSRAVNILN